MRRIREEPTHQHVVEHGLLVVVLVALAYSLTIGVSRAVGGPGERGATITAYTEAQPQPRQLPQQRDPDWCGQRHADCNDQYGRRTMDVLLAVIPMQTSATSGLPSRVAVGYGEARHCARLRGRRRHVQGPTRAPAPGFDAGKPSQWLRPAVDRIPVRKQLGNCTTRIAGQWAWHLLLQPTSCSCTAPSEGRSCGIKLVGSGERPDQGVCWRETVMRDARRGRLLLSASTIASFGTAVGSPLWPRSGT